MKNIVKLLLLCICCLGQWSAAYCAVYDVTNYYQTGDTSYAEAVGRAITAADGNGGGIIYFPPGTYQIHQSIYAKKNLTFEGNSGPGGSSVIQATGSSAFNLFCCFNADAGNVVFKNLVIDLNNLPDGGDTVGIGIYVHSDTHFNGADPVTGTKIENCEIKNGSSHGIRGFHSCTDGSIPFRMSIENCKIHDFVLQGVNIQSGTGVMINECEIYNCEQCAIYLSRGTGYVIDSCNIYDNDVHGITVCYASHWQAVNNTVTNCGMWGICAGGGNPSYPVNTHYVISNNISLENGWGGITVDPTIEGQLEYLCPSYAVIANNICSSTVVNHGIHITHATDLIIKANICHDNTNSGVFVYGKNVLISDNICSGIDPQYNANGIYLTDTASSEADHLLDHNIIYGTYRTVYISDYLSNVISSLVEDLTL